MITATLKLARESGFNLDVALQFDRHITALYGPSGSGKSTILRLLAGLERGRTSDTINVVSDGVTWHNQDHFVPPHKRHVGYVFQQPQLFPHLSVRANLEYAQKRAGSVTLASWEQVCAWLDLTGLLPASASRLSGGEAQRVAIGRVLLSGASCILMDEPLGSIDQAARARILPYLERLHKEINLPMVYVSHSLEEVNYLADRVYMLEAGQVRLSGSVFETSQSLDANRDEGDAVAAVTHCRVTGHDTQFGLMELDLEGNTLFVATPGLGIGREVRLRIPARDVSIALARPVDTSILNIIPVTVDDIREAGAGVLLRLAVGHQFILARITRKSLFGLRLVKEQPVFAQIKGVALLTDHG